MKPQTAWAIVAPSGKFLLGTVRHDRQGAMVAFENQTETHWDQFEKLGYQAVRVRIEAIDQEGEG